MQGEGKGGVEKLPLGFWQGPWLHGVHEWPAKCPVFFCFIFRQKSAGSALGSTVMKRLCTERKGAAGVLVSTVVAVRSIAFYSLSSI